MAQKALTLNQLVDECKPLVVGYDTAGKEPYLRIKNSWVGRVVIRLHLCMTVCVSFTRLRACRYERDSPRV
jgi:hypothetical protein